MSAKSAQLLSAAARKVASAEGVTPQAARALEREALESLTALVFNEPTPPEVAGAQLLTSIITARRLVHLDAEGDRR